MMMRALSMALVASLCVCGAAFAAGGGHGDGKAKSKTPAKRQITTLAGWIDVDPFTVSIIQRQTVNGTFMVAFGIDVPDSELRAKAEGILPRLRNNWLLSINQFAATYLRPGAQPDIESLATRLQRVTDETLGKPGAKVLLSNVIATMN